MDLLNIQHIGKTTVVEFNNDALMDPLQIEQIGEKVYHLVDVEDHRRILLDFHRVQYLSSQSIGIVLSLHKKLAKLPGSCLVLCSVCPKLIELLKITRLDRMLTVKPSQKEAMRFMENNPS